MKHRHQVSSDTVSGMQQRASNLIKDGNLLKELVQDNDLDVYAQLARAMRVIDEACDGDRIATEACLNALSHIQRLTFATALRDLADEAQRKILTNPGART